MMSAFNPNSRQLTPAEWQAIASESVGKSNPQIWVIGGIVGGLFAAAATGFVPSGILIAIWGFYQAWQSTDEVSRNETAISSYGCVAHLLEGDNFRDFSLQVGDQEVLAQIHWAMENQYAVSATAQKFYERHKSRPSLPSHTPNPPSPMDTLTPKELYQYQLISPNGWVNSPPPPDPIVKNFAPANINVDIIEWMARELTNHFIVGIPGSGKGILMSNVLDLIKKIHPHVKICYIDPKGDDKETGYFAGRVDYLWRAKIIEQSPPEAVAWVQMCFEEFQAIAGDKLIILDEGTATVSKFKNCKGALPWLKDKIVSYCSCGDSAGLRFWIVVQNPQAEDLGINAGLRSQLVPVCLVSPKNMTAYNAIISTQLIPSDKKISSSDIEHIANRSPVNRAIYHGGINDWLPMPKLENFSGYDRDKREFISSSSSSKYQSGTTAVLAPVETKPKTQQEILLEKLLATNQTSLDSFIREDLGVKEPTMHSKIKSEIIPLILESQNSELLSKFI